MIMNKPMILDGVQWKNSSKIKLLVPGVLGLFFGYVLFAGRRDGQLPTAAIVVFALSFLFIGMAFRRILADRRLELPALSISPVPIRPGDKMTCSFSQRSNQPLLIKNATVSLIRFKYTEKVEVDYLSLLSDSPFHRSRLRTVIEKDSFCVARENLDIAGPVEAGDQIESQFSIEMPDLVYSSTVKFIFKVNLEFEKGPDYAVVFRVPIAE